MWTLDSIKYQSCNPIKNLLIKRFQEKLLALIKITQANRILDVGCGEGYLLKFISERIRNCEIEGFDVSTELINKAKQKGISANLSVRDIYNCGYSDELFDLVLNIEVLEHLEYPERALIEIRRLTNRWVILSVPNEPLFAISNLLAGRNILTFGRHKEHCNMWSANTFIKIVSNYFKVYSVSKPFPWTIVLCEKPRK